MLSMNLVDSIRLILVHSRVRFSGLALCLTTRYANEVLRLHGNLPSSRSGFDYPYSHLQMLDNDYISSILIFPAYGKIA